MAEAACGPSNPLQSFQKHTSVDRTLQQDRLTSRQSPSQTFRSSDPNAGILDPEFEAFQAGQPGLSPQPQPQFQQAPPSFAGPSALPSWASDFQRLHIIPESSQSPTPFLPQSLQRQPPQKHALQHSSNSTSWHQDFLGQQSSASTIQPFQPLFQQPPMLNHNDFMNPVNYPLGPEQSMVGHGIMKEKQADMEDKAFERAFDLADEGVIEQQKRDHLAELAELERRQEIERQAGQVMELEREQMGKTNATEYPLLEKTQETRLDVDDSDELSWTAGQLLDSVADNSSSKFRESNFLALMRKLRDKEVKVQGDKMVETDSDAPTGAAPDVIPPSQQDADLGRANNVMEAEKPLPGESCFT